nr:DNA polymerase III subunit delta' [Deinobacterium chartae]
MAQQGAHALMLVGPSRVGRRPLARWLAARVNCAQPQAPCGSCPSCLAAAAGTHGDVWEVGPRLTTTTGKAARRALIPISVVSEKHDSGSEYERHIVEWLMVAPHARRKVVVIDGAEHLNEAAANALLKTVEEPPHGALFVFLTEELGRVMPTIASRATRVAVPPVADAELEAALLRLEGRADPELLAFAQGRPGVLFEREAVREALGGARTFLEAVRGSMLEALDAAEGLEKRFDPQWHPEALAWTLRDAAPQVRLAADAALQEAWSALEQYVSPALVFQVLALRLRAALGCSG